MPKRSCAKEEEVNKCTEQREKTRKKIILRLNKQAGKKKKGISKEEKMEEKN